MDKKLIISIIILVVINLLTIAYYSIKNNSLKADNYNLLVQQDTLKKSYDKLTNEYKYNKASYAVYNASQLEQYNKLLYQQVKANKKTTVAIQSTTSAVLPSQQIINLILDTNSNYIYSRFKFLYSDSSLTQKISGLNRLNRFNSQIITQLDTNTTTIKLKYSIIKDQKGYQIQAFTSSKYLNISNLDAVYIENKPENRLKIGLFMGYGLNSNSLGGEIRTGFAAGIGVSYRLF